MRATLGSLSTKVKVASEGKKKRDETPELKGLHIKESKSEDEDKAEMGYSGYHDGSWKDLLL
jgi:hypothetical protein